MPVPACSAVTLSSWYRGARTVDRLGAVGHICLSGMSAVHSVIAAGLSPSVFRCSACI